ncbi:MAG: glutamate synthase subunit beta [bacterium]|nr:glutamate synthase subunit beta [bacterium]
MGDPKGFLKVKRLKTKYRLAGVRTKDYRDVVVPRKEEVTQEQASRCMDCGTPFCHWGCPIGNHIPDWNDLVYHSHWERAIELLHACNNLPEITGRLCPALCEFACVLGINDDPVTIRENELAIIEQAFKIGLIKPEPPLKRTGKKVAVIGSGPAGLAAADQLNKAGHKVTVFEKDAKPGGILRYGIPDFKLEKSVLDRRLEIYEKEGIEFRTGINAGCDYPVVKLLKEFDAVCLAGGSRQPRDLKIKGRELKGVHFAMDYLTQSNKRVSGEKIPAHQVIDAKGKKVVVIGGGDTGADCVGTAHRQGASCVVQIELLPKAPECRTGQFPWPKYPLLLKTSSSHEEGGEREWAIQTREFSGEKGQVKHLECVRLDWSRRDAKGCATPKEIDGSEFSIQADLVLLALGFLHPEQQGLLEKLKVELDQRGNVKAGEDHQTSVKKVFTAGDMHRGQSLIVWAISEGRTAAYNIDKFLMGKTNLPKM